MPAVGQCDRTLQFDYIVVGAGAAGCVLANRLSASGRSHVLLIEAGSDLVPGSEPASIRDPFPSSYGDPQFAWPELQAEVGVKTTDGSPRFSRHYVQGRGMGGSSSIMGMMAQRGMPSDFEEWAAMGATGWDWQGVLPFFNRLEHDLDYTGPMHGNDGPIPVRRTPRDQWGLFSKRFAEAMQQRNYPWLSDLNGQFGDGISTVPMNNFPDRRVSAASAYLDAQVRKRPNLTILTNATAERLQLSGTRVNGVVVKTAVGIEKCLATETILCAGALHTPGLLLRSGIGSDLELRAVGISPVLDLPGVGKNLANHPTVHLAVHLPKKAAQSAGLRTWAQAVLRYSSGFDGCPSGDMLLFPANKTSWHPLGMRVGALGVCVYKSYSRGDVKVQSADPGAPLKIRFNLLDDERDYERMVSGLKFALEALADPLMASVCNEVFLPSGGQANKLNRPGFKSLVSSTLINQAFALGPVRRAALGSSVLDVRNLVNNDRALRELVNRAAAPVHHVCGTAKMGQPADRMAVVDPQCRIYGLTGARVVDASIMPSIVSANTHLTVLMIAEKAADIIQRTSS